MGPVALTLLSAIIVLFTYLLVRAYKINQYWAERGVPHVKPLLFLGNSAKKLFMRLSLTELHESICKQFPNEPYIGFYDYANPALLIRDVNLVEKILIKDFNHFTDHGLEVNEELYPLESGLFMMTGKRWRALRAKLAPIFTSGKLKFMFETLKDCGNALVSLLEKNNKDVDLKDVFGRFSMDVIGSCAFGIDTKNLVEEENEFRQMGRKQFQMDFVQYIKLVLATNFPSVFKALKISFNKPEVVDYFGNLLRNTLEHRKRTGVRRNDFIQLMIQLQQKGYVEIHTKDASDDYLEINTDAYKTETFEISDDLILGQAFLFLTAGFEAAAVLMMYALYELVKHPKIMDKVREEIKLHAKDNDSLTFETLKELTYLEQCIKETFRVHSPTPVLLRVCTKEYALPNGHIVKVGDTVLIPVRAIHYDSQYYPEPNEYRPERFGPDRVIPSCAYLSFGNGPRMCIAMRFAMMQLKYGLAKLIMNFDFKISSKTVEPLEVDPICFVTTPKHKVYFDITKIESQ